MAKLTSGNTQQHRDVRSCEFNTHAGKNAGRSNKEPDHESENAELEINRTDAETIKELVQMKFLPKMMKLRFSTHSQRLFSRKYQVLIEEVYILVNHNIALHLFYLSCRRTLNLSRAMDRTHCIVGHVQFELLGQQ